MRIAIVGCGQLARMMALAGLPMGFSFSFLATKEEDTRCVDGLGKIVRHDDNMSNEALFELLEQPFVITVEKEHVDTDMLEQLSSFARVSPSPDAILVGKNRAMEKQLLSRLDIQTSEFEIIHTLEEAKSAVATLGLPVVIKSLEGGYDGKNQWQLKTDADLKKFLETGKDLSCIVEKFIAFDREISIISARSLSGEVVHYTITENEHKNGILHQSIAPARNTTEKHAQIAQQYMEKLLNELSYVGVLAMECFVAGDAVLVNELAPRVHNSGHWTQTGSATCQFENHIRAIAGLSLGSTKHVGITAMKNLLGVPKPPIEALRSNTQLHWYNKIPKPGRKLGHYNISGDSLTSVESQLESFSASLTEL